MFKSVNELDKLNFDDCVLTGIEKAEDGIIFNAEALIIKANNSQNENFTESYAGSSQIKFEKGAVKSEIKCGYKYYNADGKLLKELPDEPVAVPEWGSIFKSFEGNYLPCLDIEEGLYTAEIEMAEADGQGDSYLIKIEAENVIVTWEKYLNRVSR